MKYLMPYSRRSKEIVGDGIELFDRTKYFLNWILIFKVFVSVIFIFGAKDLVYPTAQCLYLFYEACGALVSWCKESKSTKFENDPYVLAKINRAKTSKGPRNSRCLSEGRRRISGEVLPNEPTCINLRMVASPLSCSATWQVYDEDKNCLSCPRWISGEELKQRSIAWSKIADRQVKYSCQISEEIGRPCRWRKSDVPSACFNPWRQKTQRCLWRDLDQSKEPDVWEFLRYVFGGGGGVVTDHSVHSMHGRSMQMATKQGTLSQLKR